MTGDRAPEAWIVMETLRAELDPRRDPPMAIHAQRVQSVGTDFYLICACGWVSLPYVSEEGAAHTFWRRCPNEEAEQERLDHRAKLRARLAELAA
jgi:hypothetical protein